MRKPPAQRRKDMALAEQDRAAAEVTEDTDTGSATSPTTAGGDTAAVTPDELEKRLNELDKRLTQRINTLNTSLTGAVSELNTKVGTATNTVNSLKSKVENNEESIKSFQGSLDQLTTDVGKAKSAVDVLTHRVDQLEQLQGELNTAFSKAIQQNRDFAKEQGDAAKHYTEQLTKRLSDQLQGTKADLEQKIEALADAPVKAHTHTVHLSGESENPTVAQGGGR